jgi:hypothetical protein
METTTSDIYTEDFIKKLADTILSKFEISSEFLNNIVDKAAATITKTKKINIINNNDNVTLNSKNKTSNTNNVVDPSNDALKILANSETTNPTPSLLQTVNKADNENLNTEEKISNKNSYLEKIKGVLENTTNKLEKVLNAPRPWELTPGTSMGYQMLKGDDNTITERSRKGFAQFMGRYATNIKQPFDYSIDDVKNQSFTQMLKQVLTDVPGWAKTPTTDGARYTLGSSGGQMGARDTLYRELFDLPGRFKDDNILKKTGNKNYTLKNFAPNPDLAFDTKAKEQSKSFSVGNPILGNVAMSKNAEGRYSYKDVWDLISSGEDKGTSSYSDAPSAKATYPLRKLISPLLRPATVSGTVTEEGKPIPLNSNNNTKQETLQKTSTDLLNDETSLFSTISKGLEKVLNTPRPWELTPGTSMGYQMLKGESKEPYSERARKGFTQFVGRYATNIKEPFSYIADSGIEGTSALQMLKQVLTDTPNWNKKGSSFLEDFAPAIGSPEEMFTEQKQKNVNVSKARDTLYREMFDLPIRGQSEMLKKIGNKQYSLTSKASAPWTESSANKTGAKTAQDDILGGTYLTPTDKTDVYKYKDIWDLTSPSDSKTATTPTEKKVQETASLREFLSPLLRPATVSGSYNSLTKEYVPSETTIFSENLKKTDQTPVLNPLIDQLEKVIKQQSKSDNLNKVNSTQTNILDNSSKFKTKGFDPDTTKSILNKTISQPTPSLQSIASKENLGINNSALGKIVNNTDRTNSAIKNLGDTIFKLAQSLNNSGSKTPQMAPIYNNTTSSRQQPVPNAKLSQTNYDPIAAVRKQFFYSPD